MKTLLSSFFDAFRVLDNDSFSVNQSLHLRNETKKIHLLENLGKFWH